MNIYLREIKANLKSLIIWSLAMSGIVFLAMQKYDSLFSNGENINLLINMIDEMPKFLQNLFGMTTLDMSTPIGYFGIMYQDLILMFSIHAALIGSNIISKEEKNKTSEFLMTKPVTRFKIITSKILAVLTNIIILNLITFIINSIMIKQYTNDSIFKEMIMAVIATLFVQLLFMSLGVFIASTVRKAKKAGIITVSILLITYVLSVIAELGNKFKILKILTPFKYFEAKYFLINKTLIFGYIILSLILITLFLFLSYYKYPKKDLSV